MNMMNRVGLTVCAVLVTAAAAQAQVTLNSVRVAAADPAALAKFYQTAFGMQETNRLKMAGGPEIFLNFGATADAAKANRNPPIVIMPRESDAVKDETPHIILNVTDMAATVKAIKAAGGTMDVEPRPFGTSGMMIAFAADPVGNRMELIQPAAR